MNDQGDCELDFSDSLRSLIAHHILQTMKVEIDSMTYYGKNFFQIEPCKDRCNWFSIGTVGWQLCLLDP